MKRVIFIIFLFLPVLFTGCETGPSENQLSSANYGPFPDDYEKIIRSFVDRVAIDPDPSSTHCRFEQPKKGWMKNDRDPFAVYEFGWIVAGWINAKNHYGGYSGEKSWDFLIRDGKIVLMRSLDIDTYYGKPEEW